MIWIKGPELILYPASLSLVLAIGALLTFVITYIISLELQLTTLPWLFLSSTINHPPASNVATFCLSPGCLMIPVMGYVRYLQLEDYKSDLTLKRPKLHTVLARASLVLSVLCALGGLGVAAFQVSADFIIHFVAAGAFFGCGALFLLTTAAADLAFPDFGLPYARRFRMTISILMLLASLALMVVLLTWDINNDDHIITAAALEIVAFICFVSVYFSFVAEFKGFQLVFRVEKAKAS